MVHVKSHQDSGPIPYPRLPLPAKLIIQADTLTHTAYVERPHPTVTPTSPEVFVTLSLNSVAVTSNLQDKTLLQYHTPSLLQYFQATNG